MDDRAIGKADYLIRFCVTLAIGAFLHPFAFDFILEVIENQIPKLPINIFKFTSIYLQELLTFIT